MASANSVRKTSEISERNLTKERRALFTRLPDPTLDPVNPAH